MKIDEPKRQPHNKAKCQIESKWGCMNSVRCTMPCLVRMLYGTGIRIGEAMKLTHADVDFTQGVLVLHECKNGQDRLVPMSLSLT